MYDLNRIICPGFFLHFFWIFIFGVNSGVKGHKMAQNDVCHIPYLRKYMILIFGTHVSNNDISKMTKKFCWSHSISQDASYECGFWYTCVKWWCLIFLFVFFWGGGGGGGARVKGQKMTLPISVCYTLYLKNCRSYHEDYWYTV